MDQTRPKLIEWSKNYRNRPNGLRCFIDVTQNEHNNNKCYTSIFKDYINIDLQHLYVVKFVLTTISLK